jgi:hypothetical protein
MKIALIILTLLSAASAMAKAPSIICRNDQRLENGGSLQEIILSPSGNVYALQTQYVASLNSSDLKIENWGKDFKCRIDEKTPLAYCADSAGNVLFVKERREVFLESLDAEKKTTIKNIDISLFTNGDMQKTLSFIASHCQILGGEA